MTASAVAPSVDEAADRLRITEVFVSIQGEALHSGCPSVFIRLTGCPLRCQYCDTAYAFSGGEWRTIDALVAEATRHGLQHVCVTGGEPLAQVRSRKLLTALCDAGVTVSLETGGAIDIGGVDERVHRIVDIKTPGSGEFERNLWTNVGHLTARDALKLVICSQDDYSWARRWLAGQPDLPCPVFFSPSYTELTGRELADWIVADGLDVRLQLQLHKLLWGDVAGR